MINRNILLAEPGRVYITGKIPSKFKVLESEWDAVTTLVQHLTKANLSTLRLIA